MIRPPFAHESTETVPGATRHVTNGVCWEKTRPPYVLQALTGCWLWRALVVDMDLDEVIHITPHRFEGPRAAMDHAEEWLQENRP